MKSKDGFLGIRQQHSLFITPGSFSGNKYPPHLRKNVQNDRFSKCKQFGQNRPIKLFHVLQDYS